MRALHRRLRLAVPPDAAFGACVALLAAPDPRRGVVERRCDPDPPRPGSMVTSVVVGRDGRRELRSRVVELDGDARRVATAALGDGPSVAVRLQVEPDGQGSTVLLTSEVTAGLTGRPRPARLLDGVLFGRAQRRSAKATLARVRELAATTAEGGSGLESSP